jgi:hypothetical protein
MAILVAVLEGTREHRRAFFLLLPRTLESPDATAASEKVSLAFDPSGSVRGSVGAVWAVVDVPLLCRINDIEAKYYADGEDAYDMRKYLRGKPPPGEAQPHGGPPGEAGPHCELAPAVGRGGSSEELVGCGWGPHQQWHGCCLAVCSLPWGRGRVVSL